ncbi:hypothetical protein T492DRAFT_890651 [Pavlovales sp. CCMP2436]|nr:hypothetical protein T492DRAFT_890651 [Pavlovales sp. CCMP2436]
MDWGECLAEASQNGHAEMVAYLRAAKPAAYVNARPGESSAANAECCGGASEGAQRP